MGITQFIVNRKMVAYFMAVLLLVGGVFSFTKLGQLEDPDFTVKTGMVVTRYPGASAAEVELEVTDRIEKAIQELPQLDSLYSESRAELSLITVDIKAEYWSDRLPQVWDELRKKVRDIHSELPPGAEKPVVMDDFSFVYGFVLALTGDGFTPEELYEHAKSLRKDLSLVTGVSRAEFWGEPTKVIYLDAAQSQLAALGLGDWSGHGCGRIVRPHLVGLLRAAQPRERLPLSRRHLLDVYQLLDQLLQRIVVEIELALQASERHPALALQVGAGTADGLEEAQVQRSFSAVPL